MQWNPICRLLLRLNFLIGIMVLICYSSDLNSNEVHKIDHSALMLPIVHNGEIFVLKSLENLFVINGDLVINCQGIVYVIDGLQKNDDKWIVKIRQPDEGMEDPPRFCKRFHPLCKFCQQCHCWQCPYYKPLCKEFR